MITKNKLKFFLLSLAAIVGFFFAENVVKKWSSNSKPTNELKQIIFSTNGKLTKQWLGKQLALKKGTDLFKLDIVAMKGLLESVPQIKQALIEKLYPNALRIQITEKQPLLKTVICIDGAKKLFFVDAEGGEFFDPICYSKTEIGNILTAIIPTKLIANKKFSLTNFHEINRIRGLVSQLNASFPNIFQAINFIDLRNYDDRDGAIWSTIELNLKGGTKIILGCHDFNLQLLKLDIILREKFDNKLDSVRIINTAAPTEVIVEYKDGYQGFQKK